MDPAWITCGFCTVQAPSRKAAMANGWTIIGGEGGWFRCQSCTKLDKDHTTSPTWSRGANNEHRLRVMTQHSCVRIPAAFLQFVDGIGISAPQRPGDERGNGAEKDEVP